MTRRNKLGMELNSQRAISEIPMYLKKKMLKKILVNTSDLFLRASDKISIGPLLGFSYEKKISEYLNIGEKDKKALIDIGANIGLVSCENGKKFRKIYCFEPNPKLFRILQTNLEISGIRESCELFNFGLGQKSGVWNLQMPSNNYGAGFVLGPDQNYSREILRKKDGAIDSEFRQYVTEQVEIRNTESVLLPILRDLAKEGVNEVFVKIDVEGMEQSIINGLVNIIPNNQFVRVIFENHDPKLDLSSVVSTVIRNATHDIYSFRLVEKKPYLTRYPRLVKGLIALFGSKVIKLEELETIDSLIGEIVLELAPKAS